MYRTPPRLARTPSAPPPTPTPRIALQRGITIVALGAAAVLLGYAYGRWAEKSPSPPAATDHPQRAPAPADRPARPAGTSFGALVPAPAPAPLQPAPVAALPAPGDALPSPSLVTVSGRPTPELVSIVSQHARRKLEEARPELIERCVPEARRGGRHGAATFTFNVTFDRHGREIARGISEDRRFRAPEVASCLRRLPIGTLRVPAPGAIVGVRVAMNLP